MPKFANKAPTGPDDTVRWASEIPATAVGKANGSSIIPSRILFPGNSYRTSTQAMISPITALMIEAINDVVRLTL